MIQSLTWVNILLSLVDSPLTLGYLPNFVNHFGEGIVIYMKYKMIVTIIIIAFIMGCNPTPKPEGKSDLNDKTDPPTVKPSPSNQTDPPIVKSSPPKLDPNSFIPRTKNYDMLSVQESKDWLRKNYWTVTYSGNTIIIQRNYKSGNVTDRSKFTMSKDSRGMIAKNNAIFTVDDNGNIRVGFFRK